MLQDRWRPFLHPGTMTQHTNPTPLRGLSSQARVEADAAALGLAIEVVTHDRPTRTAAEAAEACGCNVAQIVKSMIFEDAAGALVLILVSGAHNADLEAIEARENLSLKRANARRIRDETGFAIGGVAPIGHLTRPTTYMDETLLTHPVVWCAAGRPDNMFAVDPNKLCAAVHPQVISVLA